MELYKVTKIIEFCYGHRLLNHKGKCCHLHGHNAVLEIDIESNKLDPNGMVLDFGTIRDEVKAWIDLNLDHKMLLWKQDPAVQALKNLNEPLYLMDNSPTAENIAKLIFNQTLKMGFLTKEIRLWETSSSYATYRGQK